MLQTRQTSDTIALNSLVDETFRSTWQYQSIYNSTVQGAHQLSSSAGLDWSAGYSIANNHIPDQASFGHEFPVLVDPSSGNVTRGNPDILIGMSRNWMRNSDKDLSATVNVTKQTYFLRKKMELKAGALARDKKRDNFYNAYSLNPQLPAGSSVQTYTNINDAVYTFKGGNAAPGLNGNNYHFTEDVLAGYVQGKWLLSKKIELFGGVRVEYTHQDYNTELGKDVEARSGKIWYTDVLPSVQLKYALTNKQSVRLSYYKALARPQFAELIPDGPDNFETFKEKGNPGGLKHSTADNIDLRYEIFPGNADQILLGAFYKNIKDPIEYTAVKVGVTSQNLIPQNIGNATNYGFEAVFTHYFGILGISANYTYTQSKVTNDSMLYSYRK
jgi:outer membrane receptor protein involved in Fe transport